MGTTTGNLDLVWTIASYTDNSHVCIHGDRDDWGYYCDDFLKVDASPAITDLETTRQ